MSYNPPNVPGPQGPQYTQQPGQYPPPGYGQQPPQKKGKKRWVVPTAVGVGAFVLGTLVGVSGQPEPEVVSQTKEVEIEVTPDACLEALELSEQAFGLAAQMMGSMDDALQGAGNMDAGAIDAARYELDELNPQMEDLSDPLNEAKAECRVAS